MADTLHIEILTVSNNVVPNKKGTHNELEIAFKNHSFQSKVEGRKIMSFGAGAPSFEVLKNAQTGEHYEITKNKNDKGYIDWIAASKLEGASAAVAAAPQASVSNAKRAVPSPKSTYETAEERAARQVLIVRQSSLSSAVATLKVDKAEADGEQVAKLAEYYTDFVFQRGVFTPQSYVSASGCALNDDIPV